MVNSNTVSVVEILDTTLRDGAQGEGISFSLQDKIAVVRALDELGVSWIEAGNPGSNPKDLEFFRLAGKLKLENSKLCAFGPTRKKGIKSEDDPQLQSLLDANTPGVVFFGKSWDLHVTEVLRVSLEENIAMIAETAAFLKAHGKTVIYDAEHFFDGWLANSEYALSTVKAALDAGADRIVLCDTNGGCFPDTIADGVRAVAEKVPGTILGIHTHDDSGFASANAAAAVKAGCRHVQGTLVGFGERCGNTSLAALIPSIEIKIGLPCLPGGKLELIYDLTRQVAEIANVSVPDNLPYVGGHAFSHKAGMHADGILKLSRSFEHIDPSLVGNERSFLMSEVGGRSAIAERVKKIDPSITRDHPVIAELARKLKELEAEGWQFEGADGSFELLVRREIAAQLAAQLPAQNAGLLPAPFFHIEAYRVVSEHPTGETLACSHAWVKVLVDGQHEIAAAEGDGPVNAMDGALRRALTRFYPQLGKVRLSDYKVRVIDGKNATAAKVRVLIESTDGIKRWATVGVSEDIIDASRAALVDSIEYKLISDIEQKTKVH
ncbi:citramalate synthase [Treponema primitia]|uniref:citramalate synthase n=1 Tax=Treponema primitia TaxID=88058 RepID=UPI0005A2F00C|nr:citramalate synthase [Treponema primitia]